MNSADAAFQLLKQDCECFFLRFEDMSSSEREKLRGLEYKMFDIAQETAPLLDRLLTIEPLWNEEISNHRHDTLLHTAIKSGLFDTIDVLLKHGHQVQTSGSQFSLKFATWFRGDSQIQHMLTKKIFELHTWTHQEIQDAFSMALYHSNLGAIRFLLDHVQPENLQGAITRVCWGGGESPTKNHIVSLILSHPNYQPDTPQQLEDFWKSMDGPLHITASQGQIGLMRTLLEHGMSPNPPHADIIYDRKMSPLCICVGAGHVDGTRLLLQYGADTEFSSLSGKTPLHLLSSKSSKNEEKAHEIAHMLLKAGANPFVLHEGMTPEEACRARGWHMVADALLHATMKRDIQTSHDKKPPKIL